MLYSVSSIPSFFNQSIAVLPVQNSQWVDHNIGKALKYHGQLKSKRTDYLDKVDLSSVQPSNGSSAHLKARPVSTQKERITWLLFAPHFDIYIIVLIIFNIEIVIIATFFVWPGIFLWRLLSVTLRRRISKAVIQFDAHAVVIFLTTTWKKQKKIHKHRHLTKPSCITSHKACEPRLKG